RSRNDNRRPIPGGAVIGSLVLVRAAGSNRPSHAGAPAPRGRPRPAAAPAPLRRAARSAWRESRIAAGSAGRSTRGRASRLPPDARGGDRRDGAKPWAARSPERRPDRRRRAGFGGAGGGSAPASDPPAPGTRARSRSAGGDSVQGRRSYLRPRIYPQADAGKPPRG